MLAAFPENVMHYARLKLSDFYTLSQTKLPENQTIQTYIL